MESAVSPPHAWTGSTVHTFSTLCDHSLSTVTRKYNILKPRSQPTEAMDSAVSPPQCVDWLNSSHILDPLRPQPKYSNKKVQHFETEVTAYRSHGQCVSPPQCVDWLNSSHILDPLRSQPKYSNKKVQHFETEVTAYRSHGQCVSPPQCVDWLNSSHILYPLRSQPKYSNKKVVSPPQCVDWLNSSHILYPLRSQPKYKAVDIAVSPPQCVDWLNSSHILNQEQCYLQGSADLEGCLKITGTGHRLILGTLAVTKNRARTQKRSNRKTRMMHVGSKRPCAGWTNIYRECDRISRWVVKLKPGSLLQSGRRNLVLHSATS
ncbi:hypothetical protein J6590_038521 [Homalodisca vitripennis]|nr:hypothetical protein J6590_038521 [Homalodisca vitripennis]